jgi:hypothetical protein
MGVSSSEEGLRARVEQCYSALQQGDWAKVEKYLTKASKPLFRNQPKKPLAEYKIQSIKLEPDGRSASVIVLVPLVSPVQPRPIPVPQTTLWRLEGRTWCMDLVPKPSADAQQWLSGGTFTTPQGPSGPVFSRDLKFDSTWLSLGIVDDRKPRMARFTFRNVGTHVVTLSEFQIGSQFLRLKTQQKEYKVGESGTLEFEFDPSSLGNDDEEAITQDVMIKTEPGGAYVKLTIAVLVARVPTPPVKP